MSYNELTDKEKQAILGMSAQEVFSRSNKSLEENKISLEKFKQINAFWLNQNGRKGKWETYEKG